MVSYDHRSGKRNQFRLRPEELRFDGKPMTIDLAQTDDGSYEITAEHLKHEALVFVYRLLFCFYAEARGGELEILPIEEDTYRLGYSLESLRHLELVPLTCASEGGGYFHAAFKNLFRLIQEGFHPHDKNDPTGPVPVPDRTSPHVHDTATDCHAVRS